ncbi:MAG: hypothetical protein IT381_14930 [Deltaproteobacteria bacterium]|nr:hypothetical protein [Deltaproteobacteria bacterium]
MTDKKDDDPVDWNNLAAEDEQRLGVSKDVLRKLMQMNPNLRGGRSTEDLMRQVKTTMKDAPSQKPASVGVASGKPPPPKSAVQSPQQKGGGDILDAVVAARADFEHQMKRFDAEQKRIQDERAAYQQKTLLKLIDECLAVDPGLTSPKSQYVLQQEKAFLDKLGFSMQKLVERQKQRR